VHPSVTLINFLSRLRGGLHDTWAELLKKIFLSRLRGGLQHKMIVLSSRPFLSRLRGGLHSWPAQRPCPRVSKPPARRLTFMASATAMPTRF